MIFIILSIITGIEIITLNILLLINQEKFSRKLEDWIESKTA